MSAGIERPQDFWARKESVVADDLPQSDEMVLSQASDAHQSHPARRSVMSSSFSPSQLAPLVSCSDSKADGLDCWVSIHFLIKMPSGEVV